MFSGFVALASCMMLAAAQLHTRDLRPISVSRLPLNPGTQVIAYAGPLQRRPFPRPGGLSNLLNRGPFPQRFPASLQILTGRSKYTNPIAPPTISQKFPLLNNLNNYYQQPMVVMIAPAPVVNTQTQFVRKIIATTKKPKLVSKVVTTTVPAKVYHDIPPNHPVPLPYEIHDAVTFTTSKPAVGYSLEKNEKSGRLNGTMITYYDDTSGKQKPTESVRKINRNEYNDVKFMRPPPFGEDFKSNYSDPKMRTESESMSSSVSTSVKDDRNYRNRDVESESNFKFGDYGNRDRSEESREPARYSQRESKRGNQLAEDETEERNERYHPRTNHHENNDLQRAPSSRDSPVQRESYNRHDSQSQYERERPIREYYRDTEKSSHYRSHDSEARYHGNDNSAPSKTRYEEDLPYRNSKENGRRQELDTHSNRDEAKPKQREQFSSGIEAHQSRPYTSSGNERSKSKHYDDEEFHRDQKHDEGTRYQRPRDKANSNNELRGDNKQSKSNFHSGDDRISHRDPLRDADQQQRHHHSRETVRGQQSSSRYELDSRPSRPPRDEQPPGRDSLPFSDRDIHRKTSKDQHRSQDKERTARNPTSAENREFPRYSNDGERQPRHEDRRESPRQQPETHRQAVQHGDNKFRESRDDEQYEGPPSRRPVGNQARRYHDYPEDDRHLDRPSKDMKLRRPHEEDDKQVSRQYSQEHHFESRPATNTDLKPNVPNWSAKREYDERDDKNKPRPFRDERQQRNHHTEDDERSTRFQKTNGSNRHPLKMDDRPSNEKQLPAHDAKGASRERTRTDKTVHGNTSRERSQDRRRPHKAKNTRISVSDPHEHSPHHTESSPEFSRVESGSESLGTMEPHKKHTHHEATPRNTYSEDDYRKETRPHTERSRNVEASSQNDLPMPTKPRLSLPSYPNEEPETESKVHKRRKSSHRIGNPRESVRNRNENEHSDRDVFPSRRNSHRERPPQSDTATSGSSYRDSYSSDSRSEYDQERQMEMLFEESSSDSAPAYRATSGREFYSMRYGDGDEQGYSLPDALNHNKINRHSLHEPRWRLDEESYTPEELSSFRQKRNRDYGLDVYAPLMSYSSTGQINEITPDEATVMKSDLDAFFK